MQLRRRGVMRAPLSPIVLDPGISTNPVQGTTTSSSFTATINNVAIGDLILFTLSSNGTLGVYTVSSITDASGDTWPTTADARVIAEPDSSSDVDAEIWGIIATKAGTHTLTVNMTGNANTSGTWALSAWKNVASATPDQSNKATTGGTSQTTSPAPSITPTQANELVITIASNSFSLLTGPGSPWTLLLPTGGTGMMAYQVQTTAAAASGVFTTSSGNPWAQVIASYKHV